MNAARSEPQVELVLDAKSELGEGPLWSAREQRLYWVDILAGAVHATDPVTRDDCVLRVEGTVGAVVERARGGLAMVCDRGFASLDPRSGAVGTLCHPEAALPGNRYNDGKVDPHGRFWAGTMARAAPYPPVANLYVLDATHRAQRALGGVRISNGLAWSPDGGTMYYIDTFDYAIAAYACDPGSAALRDRRVVATIDPARGLPDGMCIDAEGMLWVAYWSGWGIDRWDPRSGRVIQTIRLPCANVSSCCFGGRDLDHSTSPPAVSG